MLSSLSALKVAGVVNPELPLFVTFASTLGMNAVPAKFHSEPGQYSPKHMAAGLAKTALMASIGWAIPTPPMDLAMGPMAIKLSPLVAKAAVDNSIVQEKIAKTLNNFFISVSSF